MGIVKEVIIDDKPVLFKASAAVPRIYRLQFGRDLFADLQKIAKSVQEDGKTEMDASSSIPIDDLSMFEQVAYVMAKHADPKGVPADIMDWLEEFETFSIYEVLPAILDLWSKNEQTMSEAKKKRIPQAVN